MGYYQAGFDQIVGVDIRHQPHYPFQFVQGDALEYVLAHGKDFDAIHASPPCQGYSWCTPKGYHANHPDLIAPTREILKKINRPYIIENVGGARRQLRNYIMLCGSMFGLKSYRHRYFETHHFWVIAPECNHDFLPLLVTTAGSNSRAIRGKNPKSVKNAPLAYGIDWMNCEELKEAIPPAFTKYLGTVLISKIVTPANNGLQPTPGRADVNLSLN